MEIRRVGPGHGWRWVVRGFGLLRKRPLMWLMSSVVLLAVATGLSLLPVIGVPVFYFLTPLLMAGLMVGCRDLEAGQDLSVGHLLLGFQSHASHLVTVGGVYMVGQVLVTGILQALAGAELQQAMSVGENLDPAKLPPDTINRLSLGLMAASAVFVPLALAVWFAPALIVLRGEPALRAMQLSTRACLANILPLLVYGGLMLLLFALALPLGRIGMIAWLPLTITTVYASFEDLFGDSPVSLPKPKLQ